MDKVISDVEGYTQNLGKLLGVELTPEISTKVFLAAMGKSRSELYRVSLLFGQQADICKQAGAYFACSLMTASAIEALLAVLCLSCQKEVEASPSFKKFKRGKTYEEKVLSADFDSYIKVASDLRWIPSHVVDGELLDAAIRDFPLVAANLFPKKSQHEMVEMADRFKTQPGLEMLCFLHQLRNLVHGPRWLRLGISTNSSDFEADCKFIVVVASQVMMCLIETFTRLAARGLANADELVRSMPHDGVALVRRQLLELAGIAPIGE